MLSMTALKHTSGVISSIQNWILAHRIVCEFKTVGKRSCNMWKVVQMSVCGEVICKKNVNDADERQTRPQEQRGYNLSVELSRLLFEPAVFTGL